MAEGKRKPRTRPRHLLERVWYTQKEMAALTGIGFRTYCRLERGQIENPPIRYLVNCARVAARA